MNKDGIDYAKKVYRFTYEEAKEDCDNEVAVLMLLDHPNTIKYFDHFISDQGLFTIITEFAPNGTLQDILDKEQLRPKTEPEILRYFTMIVQGVNYLHGVGIIHRDLKPDNIFMGIDGLLKIGDYGLSKILSHSKKYASSKYVRTAPIFKAPELIRNKGHRDKVDEWALGVILYFMCSQKWPYDADDEVGLINFIKSKKRFHKRIATVT